MKKFSLLLVFVLVVSAMPSFATKVIVNDNNDRVVYSRSTGFDERIDETVYDSYLKSYNQKRNQELNIYQTTLLSKEFRTELAGKKWVLVNNSYNNNNNNLPSQQIQNLNFRASDRLSREAADYYYVDKNNPYIKYPSGYLK